jgi:hypothetical protein
MKRLLLVIFGLGTFWIHSLAQVNTVQFGKNRVQYKNFKWRYYQAPNFNVYFSDGGLNLARFVVEVAEEELPGLERFVEYGMQRRANIIVYNDYNDYRQSNVGMDFDWQNSGGMTKLVNSKLVVYYTSDHNELRRQIREGIARVLVSMLLFGDDIGEFAGNSTLLDLPKWLTDGFITYAAQPWSTAQDDQLKSTLLTSDYKNFYQFAFEQPDLAGQAFWYYIQEKYGKEKVSYLFYLARLYKNLNHACQEMCKKKFKDVLADFMQFEQQKYYKDIRGRRNIPKGRVTVSQEITPTKDYYHFEANPNPRNYTYAVVQFKKGRYKLLLYQNFVDGKVLWKDGVMQQMDEKDPHYPLIAWDPKGTRLAYAVSKQGQINVYVYDMFSRTTINHFVLDRYQQLESMKYMLDNNTLLLSATRNGHSDIYKYKIKEQTSEQLTNDVYDDLDPTFVAFPNKTGILFSSNRPSAMAKGGDTAVPSRNRFNIFMVDDNGPQSTYRQITQLTNLKYGNASYPMPYNTSNFTFITDENGINNRFAGFFSTKRAGLDTLVTIGDDVLRNPSVPELDSALKSWNKTEPDSVALYSVTNDSTYIFPLTNYQSGVLETDVAGVSNQVTEVSRQGDYKFLYKLQVDEKTLHNRNLTDRPTDYMRGLMKADQLSKSATVQSPPTRSRQPAATDTTRQKKPAASNDFFESEFNKEKPDTSTRRASAAQPGSVAAGGGNAPVTGGNVPSPNRAAPATPLSRAKLFNYKLKFSTDYVVANLNNSVLFTQLQPYAGGSGPIEPSNGSDLTGMLRVSISDLLEDYKFIGGVQLSTDLKDNDYLVSFQNYKHRIDYGVSYYRAAQAFEGEFAELNNGGVEDLISEARTITNIYQLNAAYPFDRIHRFDVSGGLRTDNTVIRSDYSSTDPPLSLSAGNLEDKYSFFDMEYVSDNTSNPAMNIWKGMRWKIYNDMYKELGTKTVPGNGLMNDLGFDFRNYVPIYRNFIWAVRAAGDFSMIGDQHIIYYLGGMDGWIGPKFNNSNTPDPNVNYVYQGLALNLRGYDQNAANGDKAMTINSEFRLPIFTTFCNKPINNAFLRNFQVTQFFDLGTAWTTTFGRPTVTYTDRAVNNTTGTTVSPISILIKPAGIGPFLGGYGFGIRSTLLGYFLKLDAGWPMNGFFAGGPKLYFSLGFDF